MGIVAETLRELSIKVSQYFLDFLESDFKRQQAPRRRIKLQTESGFRSAMRVAAYPGLQHNLWQIMGKRSDADPTLRFTPKAYHRPISNTLRLIIREQIEVIAEEELLKVRAAVFAKAEGSRGVAVEDPEDWVEGIRTELAEQVGSQIVAPLLALLDGPLSEQSYSVHDSIYSAESELIEIVASRLDTVMPEVLSRYLATGENAELIGVLETHLALDDIRSEMLSYFEAFMAADAFLEFRDLDTYAMTGEGLQLYLYIGQLKFGGNSYPLFFVPVEVERSEAGYVLKLINHLYANKRAIDFVLQELGERQQRQWLSPINDRITYLGPEQSIVEALQAPFRKIANALDLGGQVELAPGRVTEASNASVLLSTALHIAVFDRSDEALLNDYEEMITQARRNEPGVMELFQGIVSGVLLDNPTSITADVDANWDERSMVDRVVIDSPVPLNEEQIKILDAIRHPAGRMVVVEGPPGTGKSHTITAIAADCALRGKSCLILSDKSEALNVVQSKLSDTMSQVRHTRDFVNPILRLGREQANFKKLTSQQTLTQVTAYVRASKANEQKIQGELNDTRELMKDRIVRTVSSLCSLSLRDLAEFHRIEKDVEAIDLDLAEQLRSVDIAGLQLELEVALAQSETLERYLSSLFERASGVSGNREDAIEHQLRLDVAVAALVNQVDAKPLSLLEQCSADQLTRLTRWLLEYDQLRMPIFGYLFRGSAVGAIERDLNEALRPTRPVLLKREISTLRDIQRHATSIRIGLADHEISESFLGHTYALIAYDRVPPPGANIAQSVIIGLRRLLGTLPTPLLEGDPAELASRWIIALRYANAYRGIRSTFAAAPQFDFVNDKSALERLNVSVMNSEVDNRLVNFMNNSRADARVLSSIITNRQKFPAEKFEGVKNAFPVIIANIRQFGEYTPLAPDVFDVVVIDEASQVSVAQAFPAMLRAKKLVVLGDTKQFSNTKSSNASIALNEKYKADLHAYFRQKVSYDAGTLQRLSRFDVKCSILEFCQLCANYSIMLRKHFRSYQELISYSSQTFYGGQLQAIKIRGVPLDEVIKFGFIDVGDAKRSRGTNDAEAQFILSRLLELLEDGDDPPTVGVITPFREQQALLSKLLFSHASGADFRDKLRLKVMTFDSCQGEERKVIFYSMVATAEHDALNYVFPVALEDAEESVEEKLKVQRLNVGFSRAEEMIWFVLSKPISDYKGTIGRVLNHYNNLLQKGDVSPDLTDASSPMEARVLEWLQKTAFYQLHRNDLEILPQFPIGEYLRQLDPTYQHPSWRVDFLITFASEKGTARIVIEYDGFEYHFQKGKNVDVGSHERYMLEADIERQLTLESYGYKFLRINRFNLGKDPVATLSDRLSRLVETLHDEVEVVALERVQATAGGLAAKELKECTKCGAIKPMPEFYDPSLANGSGATGRVCMQCKRHVASSKVTRPYSGRGRYRQYRRRWR